MATPLDPGRPSARRDFPLYGFAGLALILLAEVLLLVVRLPLIGTYFTPCVWTGYILLVDALNFTRAGGSLLTSRRREFLAMLPWSILCWLVFEAYNSYLQNWTYHGLPENLPLRLFGFAWSFATIFPAVLETAEFYERWIRRPADGARGPAVESREGRGSPISRPAGAFLVVLGGALLLTPLVVPRQTAGKLFALVWIGFIFVLDPVNDRYGNDSLLRRARAGDYATLVALALAGVTCGLLWEFWNAWATTRWVYHVPIAPGGPKIFEMPLVGFPGFIPFAAECYVMMQFLLALFPSLRKTSPT